jgi:hypothetical protein
MADDDERFRRAARPAIVNARGRLDQARVNLEATVVSRSIRSVSWCSSRGADHSRTVW